MIPTTTQRRAALEARHPTWEARTISHHFDRAAEEFPDRPYLMTPERTYTYTYAEMRDWSRAIASGLIARGIQARDHVALVLANYPEFVAVKLAISRVGAVAVPINYNLRRNELAYILGQSNARALFVMDQLRDIDYLTELDAIIPGWDTTAGGGVLPDLGQVFVLATAGGEPARGTSILALAESRTRASDAALPRREAAGDPHFRSDVIYTSGTTGRPKGSMCTHDMVARIAYASAYTRAFDDGRRIIFALPMYHVFGYVECMIAATFVGGAVIPFLAFDAEQMLSGVERFQATELVGVPLMTLAEIDLLKEKSFDLSSLVAVFNSGGLSPAWIWGRIREVFGVEEICTAYGMTETTASTTCVLPEDPDERFEHTHGRMKLGGVAGEASLGGALAEYRAVDPETGLDVPPGAQGELICRGPVLTLGYYNKPEETADAFTPDGWFCTGDMGTIDADGYLTLTGRLKESYRCNGEMVMPKEIEDLLNEHPLVEATYVVGLPHPKMGEIGCVCVVPAGPVRVDPEELVELCRANLARFKVPRHVVFVSADEVPMTATGRPQKFKLIELAEARLQEIARDAEEAVP